MPLVDHKAPTLAYSTEQGDKDVVHPGEAGMIALTLAYPQENKPELEVELSSSITSLSWGHWILLETLEGNKLLRADTLVLTCIT